MTKIDQKKGEKLKLKWIRGSIFPKLPEKLKPLSEKNIKVWKKESFSVCQKCKEIEIKTKNHVWKTLICFFCQI